MCDPRLDELASRIQSHARLLAVKNARLKREIAALRANGPVCVRRLARAVARKELRVRRGLARREA